MNEQDFRQLWLDSTEGELQARLRLAAQLREHPDQLEAYAAERQVDALLRVLAAPPLEAAAVQAREQRFSSDQAFLETIEIDANARPQATRPSRQRYLAVAGLLALAGSLLAVLGLWGSYWRHAPATALPDHAAPTNPEAQQPARPATDPHDSRELVPIPSAVAIDPADTRPVAPEVPDPGPSPADANPAGLTPQPAIPAPSDTPAPRPIREPGLPAGLELVRLDGSAWEPAAGEIRARDRVKIPSGSGMLRGPDGLEISFTGPMEADIPSGESIRLISGNYLVRTPRTTPRWQLETPLVQLQPRGGSEFQLRVDGPRELEAWVERGKLTLQRPVVIDGELPLVLSDGRLPQALVSAPGEPALPTVMLSQGPRLFLGQVLFEQQAAPTRDPQELARIVEAFESNQQAGQPARLEAWNQLAQQMQQAQRQANRPPLPLNAMLQEVFPSQVELPPGGLGTTGNSQSNSAFQGSININGQSQQFDSPEAFENARQQIPQLGNFPGFNPLGGLPLNELGPGNANPNRAFDAEVNLNGRRLRFTSPQQFEAFRQQFNRK